MRLRRQNCIYSIGVDACFRLCWHIPSSNFSLIMFVSAGKSGDRCVVQIE